MSVRELKHAAQGKWAHILGIKEELLDGKGHPCPMCRGNDRFNVDKNFQQNGKLYCRHCIPKGASDGIAAYAWLNSITNSEAIKRLAEQLGVASEAKSLDNDLIEALCRDKRMPIDAFKQFGPTIVTFGRDRKKVVSVPMYDANCDVCGEFRMWPGHKGLASKGSNLGLFLPLDQALPRLPKAGETWCLVEGVKDAAALVGLGFNAIGLPTSQLNAKFAPIFRDVHVIYVPDNDEPGQNGAQKSGGNLSNIAASVRIARLPGEILKSNGEDVRDVLKRPSGEQLVRDAIANAVPWQPREGEPSPEDGRPEVFVTLNLSWTTDQVVKHLGRLGWDSPWIPPFKRERSKLYQRGGELVQVVLEEEPLKLAGGIHVSAGHRIRPLPFGQLPLRISEACHLKQEIDNEKTIKVVSVQPPRWLIDGIHTRGDFGGDVRRLTGVITAPTLRVDGTILQQAGYDAKTGLLFSPIAQFEPVPESPTLDDAKQACRALLEVIQDFEFVADADRGAFVAMVLSLIGREAVSGCVPMFAIGSTCRGSGKTLLADAASLVAFGRPIAKKPYSTDDDEQRKAITAIAMEAIPAVLLDNVDRKLGGAALDAALTTTVWSDRVLGSSKTTGELPLRPVWIATGNNIQYGSDLERRVIPIRLAPTVESPEERTGFKHADLPGWIRENRPRLAVAALTILRGYFVAGCPSQDGGQFGSFESWSKVIRGAIVWAGLSDPLATRETAKADDNSGTIVKGLIGGILEVDEYGDGMTAREIVQKLESSTVGFPTMREVVAEVATYKGRIDVKRLGNYLKKYRGRIANGCQLDGTLSKGGVMRWKVRKASEGGSSGSGWSTPPKSYAGACVSHDTYTHTYACDTHTPHIEPGEIDHPDQLDPPCYEKEVLI